jgi:hypothetical protein
MHSKLAGRLPLSEMIAAQIEDARVKIAESEAESEKVKRLVEYEKKEHGGKIPTPKEEKAEKAKKAAAIDPANPEDVEKLAMALEAVGDMLKEADSVELGTEPHQGGTVLPTQSVTPGKQPYKHDKAKHTVPTNTGLMTPKDNPGGSKTAVPTDDARAPGGTGAKYPANGPLRKMSAMTENDKSVYKGIGTGIGGPAGLLKSKLKKAASASDSVRAKIEAARARALGEAEPETAPDPEVTEKKASAVQYLLDKMAESPQGGLTLDSKSGEGPKPAMTGPRAMIASNTAPAQATKREAKAVPKKDLKQVLTEPAQSKATDSKVHENLRNASKGGVKIAAARALIKKIASDKNHPRHEFLKQALAKLTEKGKQPAA